MPPPLASAIAARFPLVARKRPAAKPLDSRVDRLVGLAETTYRERDPEKASMVFNGAALVASDCGDTELARAWCHRHADLYLSQAPLDGYTARFALEPVVNLARLHIRDGDGDRAHRLLTDLYAAIVNGTRASVDDLEIHPGQFPADPDELEHIIRWLRSVLLSDGTRALTCVGRWDDALTHVYHYDGIGPTLLDGRQAVIVAHLLHGEGHLAGALLDETKIEQPWEQAVHGVLKSWQTLTVDAPRADHDELIDRALAVPQSPGLSVFRVRLILTALDLAIGLPTKVVDDLTDRLASDVISDEDAHAARDLLHHPAVSHRQQGRLSQLITASGLGRGHLPDTVREPLASALGLAGTVIHRSRFRR
ncbi:hypothetical protein [Micromonospora echinofusca]|uniref:Uncharacterized protein n=1 Tax=Micromonospora echinofusca TaxID=47858 RepID=A0ABS3VMJ2_MICEH|nr:hypothetical protein [Micromonospora echinofusca]MBO4205594.1 hypothetical protein [Micromonospora echinofusca]